MSVTLSEVERAARAHRAPLAGESAGYLVLALADQVSSAPRLVDARDVQLSEDGGLRVLRGPASSEAEAELSLRRALDQLLLVASSGSAALMRAGRRSTPVGLAGLVRELEAALIPVNRAAAQRALSRLHRETARALASGLLAAEAPAPPPLSAPEVPLPAVVPVAAVIAPPAPEIDLPPALSARELAPVASSDAAGTLLEASPLNDALTIALDVRGSDDESATVLLEEDIEWLEPEPSEALTQVREAVAAPIAEESHAGEPLHSDDLGGLAEEAWTRPEPVILRNALRPLLAPDLMRATVVEALPRTPTLGSLAAELPVLAPERLAELNRRELPVIPHELTANPPPTPCTPEVDDEVVSSLSGDQHTDLMPEVAPLSPAIAIVPSRQSDVSELLAGFQLAPDDTHEGLRRAIKEMADLDLTPAPFASLLR